MNCAVHPDVPVAAYCRTCGKALCESCKRDVRGVFYCEDCLAARLQGTLPEAAAGAPPPPAVVISSGPSPGLAGVLAAFFPFGVGQVYCGLYAKGLLYMIIFALLVWGASWDVGPHPVFGLAIAFFYVYQIIDAVRSARALQLGQAPPDPLGAARIFGNQRLDTSRIPFGAVALIVVGVFLFLWNLGRFHWMGDLWPGLLVVLGVWLIVRRWTSQACNCPRCRCCGLTWPVFLATLGILWLLDNFDVIQLHHSFPLLLIVAGVMIVLERSAPQTGHLEPGPPAGSNPPEGSVTVSQGANR